MEGFIMQEARLSVRVDEDIKKRAECVFSGLGLTLSAGITLYLNQVAIQQGIPFTLTQIPQNQSNNLYQKKQIEELRAQIVVELKQKAMQSRGLPIALFDDEKQIPYMLYPDGQKMYDNE